MANTAPLDPTLAAIAGRLGLRKPADQRDWDRRALERLGAPFYQEVRRLCGGQGWAVREACADEFYSLVGERAELAELMLEARLGYYDAVLPAVCDALRERPHARIVDLGSYAGLASAYLGARFPASEVVGVERCAALVRRARMVAASAGATNVIFHEGDYNAYRPGVPFDAVVCLRAAPTELLPFVPSQSPDTFRRGAGLLTAASQTSPHAPAVEEAVRSVRRLSGEGGLAALHLRLQDVSRGLLFSLFLHRAGLRVVGAAPVSETAEGVAVDHGPLLLATPCPGPPAFDEGAVIDLHLPPPGDARPPNLRAGQCYVTAGRKAQDMYGSLPGGRDEVVVDANSREARGRASRVRVGVAGRRIAYGYFSRDDDVRELRLCGVVDAGWLFRSCLDDLAALQRRGGLTGARPGLEEVATLTRGVLARSASPLPGGAPPHERPP